MDGGLTAANGNTVSYSQGHAAAKPKLLKTNSIEITQVKDSGAKNTQEGWDAGILHHLDILKGLFWGLMLMLSWKKTNKQKQIS